EASKVENAAAEMLRDLDQLMERKEDGGADKTYNDLRDMYGGHDRMTMEFITRLLRSSSGYDTNWVIADRLTKSAYFMAIREDYKMEKLAMLYINEIVAGHGVPVSIILDRDGKFTSKVLENITESLRDAIGYEYGLSSSDGWTKCSAFRKKDMLTSRYVGPFEILKRVGPVAYRLRLPDELSSVHDIIHVSNLKKCLADANMHVPLYEIKVDKTLRFVEEPEEIMDREVKSLKRRKISIF
nr:hypothetical protein [Tanacetum cinerariifolium]